MADTGIFATTLEVQEKAGDNASTTASAEAYTNSYMSQVESTINGAVRFNFSDAYSGLNTDVKKILTEVASNLAAIYVLNYKPSGQDGNMSRIEYEDRINILRDAALRGLSILRDKKVETFINGA